MKDCVSVARAVCYDIKSAIEVVVRAKKFHNSDR